MIKRVEIENLGPFAGAVEFTLPSVVTIEGGNGKGKTGLLEVIQYIGAEGHDPDILHGNAESGEVTLVMDDGKELRARVTPDTTSRMWKTSRKEKWTINRKLIDDLFTALAYNPVEFLSKKPAEQAQILLRLAPIPVEVEEVLEAIGDAKPELKASLDDINLDGNPLDIIDGMREVLYNQRKDHNLRVKQSDGHAADLTTTLPAAAPDGTNWTDEFKRLRGELEAEKTEEGARQEWVNQEFQKSKSAAESVRAQAYTASQKIFDEEYKRIIAEHDARKEEAVRIEREAIEAARRAGEEEFTRLREPIQANILRLTSEVATAEERAKAEQLAAGTRKAIDLAQATATTARANSARLTAAIDRLDALMLKLAERLPIPGIRVAGGRIVRTEGDALVPLLKWNTSDRIKFSLKIGMLIGGKAGVCCVDRFESFDDANQEMLIDTARHYAEAEKMQFLFAKVRHEGGEMVIRDWTGS